MSVSKEFFVLISSRMVEASSAEHAPRQPIPIHFTGQLLTKLGVTCIIDTHLYHCNPDCLVQTPFRRLWPKKFRKELAENGRWKN